MWRLCRLAVSEAWGADAALLADGTIRSAAQRLGEGWRTVVVPRSRVIKEEVKVQAWRQVHERGTASHD